MRIFQMVMAVLFCAALTFYLWVAVPRVQAQDTSMPVLTDETDGELALSVTAPETIHGQIVLPKGYSFLRGGTCCDLEGGTYTIVKDVE